MTQVPTRTLYDLLGRDAGFGAVVDRFHELVLLDPLLRPPFAGMDMADLRVALHEHQVASRDIDEVLLAVRRQRVAARKPPA